MGRRLIGLLQHRGYVVKALVQASSVRKLPAGCQPVVANPFDATTFADAVDRGSIFIHLSDVHAGWKSRNALGSAGLLSVQASVMAAKEALVSHFIYVNGAEGERCIRESGLRASFVRSWYVRGPGHYWPLLLQPLFGFIKRFRSTVKDARSLRPVTLNQMLHALVWLTDHGCGERMRIMEAGDILSRRYEKEIEERMVEMW